MSEHFIYGESHADRVVRTAFSADLIKNLFDKTHSVFKASAVFISAEVCIWREELLQQIAVCTVELDTVDTGLLTSDSAVTELLNEFLDLFVSQGSCLLSRIQAHAV